ncbi:hypothetical protein EPN29_10115 [bacterium]|nr:MAG: hypothetical protein EPN29_10115 [bacterium]
MIDLLFAFVLLFMAAAIVVLFAMLGELASRIPQPARLHSGPSIKPVEGARIGHVASWWPTQLAYLKEARDGVLLVLSSACASCEEIGVQFRKSEDPRISGFGILMSCGNIESGHDFIARHGLSKASSYIDKGGEWVRGEFNVMMSPVALFFREGRLQTALVFDDLDALHKLTDDGQSLYPIPTVANV